MEGEHGTVGHGYRILVKEPEGKVRIVNSKRRK